MKNKLFNKRRRQAILELLNTCMEYRKATLNECNPIYEMVQTTIKTVYPKYYPKEVVDFFCEHHSRDNILRDIENGMVGVLVDNDRMVGTGCYQDNHITRLWRKNFVYWRKSNVAS